MLSQSALWMNMYYIISNISYLCLFQRLVWAYEQHSTVPCVLQCGGLAMQPLMPFLKRVGLVSRRRPCYGAVLTTSMNAKVNECQAQSSSVSHVPSPTAPPAAKRLRSTLGGINDKQNVSGAARQRRPSIQNQSWSSFKRHTVALDDQVMCDRINCLIESAGDQPYALEIRYHHKCWLKHVRTYQKMRDDDKLPLMNNVSLREAQTIFFDHIRAIIFEEHELRSLQSLLRDYSSIVSRYNYYIIAELYDNDNDFPKQNSEYIDIDELLKTKYKFENCKYACLHLNFFSLPSKLAKLEILLNTLSEHSIVFHMILICETFLNDNNCNSCHLTGYNFVGKKQKTF